MVFEQNFVQGLGMAPGGSG